MTSARPGRLRLGERVRFAGHTYTVVGLSGMSVRLADVHGVGILVDAVHLQSAEDFAVFGVGDRAVLGSAALLEHLPAPVAERALWWQRHLVELLTGLRPDAPTGTRPRPEFDPARHSLAERERAKAAEMTALGETISARSVKRKRQQYEAGGVQAVVDHRLAPHASLLGHTDPRVVAAVRQAISESVPASTRTIEHARWHAERILAVEHGEGVVAMPSRATFYRLFDKLSHGVHMTGSARTRLGEGHDLTWPVLIRHLAPGGWTHPLTPAADADAVATLFQLLNQFLDQREQPDGLTKIFKDYHSWLNTQTSHHFEPPTTGSERR